MKVLMKKVVACIAVLSMIFSMTITGYAAEYMTITLTGGSLEKGGEIVVPVAVKNNTGIGAADLQLMYDNDNLKIKLITSDYSEIDEEAMNYGGFFGALTPNFETGTITWASAKAYTKNANLFWVVFTTTDNVNNGTYSVSLTHSDKSENMFADGDSKAIQDSTINMIPAEIKVTGGIDRITESNAEISGIKTEYVYTGSPITPEVKVVYGGRTLVSGKDYTVTYHNNTGVGTASVEIAGTGTYQGTIIKTFEIVKVKGTITVEKTAYTKTYGDATFKIDAETNSGAELKYQSSKPAVADVAADGTVTIKGAGTASITVSADETENYTAPESKIINITVNKADQVLIGTTAYEKTYGDPDFKLDTAVKDASGTLTYTADSSGVVSVSADGTVTVKKAGTGKITVNAAASENYNAASMEIIVKADSAKLSVTGEKKMTIYNNGKSFEITGISAETVDQSNVTYSYQLKSGSDFLTLNDDNTVKAKKTGTAVIAVTMTADNHASETVDITVTIQDKIDVSDSIIFNAKSETSVVYNAEERALSEFVNEAACRLPGTISYQLNGSAAKLTDTVKNAGTYIITAVYEDDENYGTKDVTITITPEKLTGITVSGSYTYTGSQIRPEKTDLSVLAGRLKVEADAYSVTYGENINAGTGYVTVTGSGNFAGSATASFDIAKANDKIAIINAASLSKAYDKTAANLSGLKVSASGDGMVTYAIYTDSSCENKTEEAVNAGIYYVKAFISGSTNHNDAFSEAASFTISKAAVDAAKLKWDYSDSYTYTGKEQTVSLKNVPAELDVTYSGNKGINAGDYTVSAVLTLKDSDNYKIEGTVNDLKWKIFPADYSVKLSAESASVKEGTSSIDFLPSASAAGVNGETPDGVLKYYTDAAMKTELTAGAVGRLAVGSHTIYWSFTTADPNYVNKAKNGTTTLNITDGDPQNIVISGAEDKTYGDAQFQLTAQVTTTGGAAVTDGGNLTWKSSDTSVVSVSENGLVTVNGTGKAVITVSAAKVAGKYAAGVQTCEINVAKKAVTVSGITAADKAYDSTTDAVISCENAIFTGLVTGDSLTVSTAGKFADAGAGEAKNVILEKLVLSGEDASNYVLAEEGQQTEAKASILKNTEPVLTIIGELAQTEGSVAPLTAELKPVDPSAEVKMFYSKEVTETSTETVSELPEGVEAGKPHETTETVKDPETGLDVEKKTVVTYTAVTDEGVAKFEKKSVVTKTVFTEELPSEAGTYTAAAVFKGNNNIAPAVTSETLTISARPSSGGGAPAVTKYKITVTAKEGGKISPASAEVVSGKSQTFTITADEGYKISDVLADGKSVGAVSTYTFENVKAAHTIEAVFVKADAPSFIDVDGHWAEDSIKAIVDAGIMNGVSESTFGPNNNMTRAMLVTILWRIAGEPAAADSGFTDVEADSWYTDAVNWASSEGIVTGFSETAFGPDKPVTREQIAAILYRFEQSRGNDVSKRADLSKYTDNTQIGSYALEAMQWANAEGLITGRTANTLDPKGTATRAEIATILVRKGL